MGEYRASNGRRSRRRIFLAAAAGASLFAAAAVVALGNFAIARGNFIPPVEVFDPTPAPARVEGPRAEFRTDASEHHAAHRVATRGLAYGSAVCVRLCDGFFFPSVTTEGGDAACAAQCPDAPVALYSEPAGSDSIADAISLTGSRYSALPVAMRHRTSFDETCTCHRSFVRSRANELLHDFTLRRGDLVMTPSGFKVFEGGGRGVASVKDFVTLTQARSLSKESRDSLVAMERAGVWNRQAGSYSASVSGTPNSEPESTRLKGILTVEDKTSAAVSQ